MLKKITFFFILIFSHTTKAVYSQSMNTNQNSIGAFFYFVLFLTLLALILFGINKLIEANIISFTPYSIDDKPKTNYGPNWSIISQDIRARDEYKCKHCGSTENLHVHHIVPRSQGGKNHPDNLITLCFNCHSKVHPHMRNLGKNSYYPNDYKNLSETNEYISNQSINIPSYRNQSIIPKNSIFCNQCGGVATLIDRQADYEKLIKTFQCEECGNTYKKRYVRKSKL